MFAAFAVGGILGLIIYLVLKIAVSAQLQREERQKQHEEFLRKNPHWSSGQHNFPEDTEPVCTGKGFEPFKSRILGRSTKYVNLNEEEWEEPKLDPSNPYAHKEALDRERVRQMKRDGQL